MCGRQRNPVLRNRLRGSIFIQSNRKAAVKYIPKPHQQNRPLFAMKSSRTHGHHAARRPRLCAARSSLFVNGQQLHRRTIYHPRRKSRLGKPLWKSKRSSLKIHPSNPSIHPNRLPLFHRSCLFRKRPRSRRSASRSRLAAVSLHHPRRSLSSH